MYYKQIKRIKNLNKLIRLNYKVFLYYKQLIISLKNLWKLNINKYLNIKAINFKNKSLILKHNPFLFFGQNFNNKFQSKIVNFGIKDFNKILKNPIFNLFNKNKLEINRLKIIYLNGLKIDIKNKQLNNYKKNLIYLNTKRKISNLINKSYINNWFKLLKQKQKYMYIKKYKTLINTKKLMNNNFNYIIKLPKFKKMK